MPDAIAGVLGTQQFGLHNSVDSAMSALGGMDSEGFLNLLVAQLRYQDPMKPSDPGDMMTQTATLAQLDANQQLLQIQQRNFGMQQAVQASSMLGTSVTGVGADGDPVSGVVEAVRYTSAGPMLRVGDQELALGAITEQRTVGAAPTTGPGTGGDDPEVWDGPLRAEDPAAATQA